MKNLLSINSLPAATTEDKEGPRDNVAPAQGWIFYDGQCRYCIAAADKFERLFARRGFGFLPLQTPWVQARLALDPDAPLDEMRLLTVAGEDLGGANALIFLLRQVWWLWPLYLVARLPRMHGLVDRGYRWIAAHRGCNHVTGRSDLCLVPIINRTPQRTSLPARIIPWAGFILVPALALFTRSHVAPWLFMWLMAGMLFLGCKWLTFWHAIQTRTHPHARRSFGYFFLWPGMDAASFLGWGNGDHAGDQRTQKVGFPLIKIAFGVLALFFFARLAPNQLLAGWIGMIGLIFILHFGLFDLAAIAWRMAGVDAKPIMNAPIKAESLNEFWGRRWNGAFNQLVLDIFFRPLARSIGLVRATLTAFLISGLLHELVISLPAGTGYGLPTSYFLLQGCGVIAQRSSIGKRFRLRQGHRGWIFTMLFTAGPAYWLFHPPFVERVIIPFMQAIGAL